MLFLPLFALISSVSSVPLQVQSEPAHNAAGYDTSLTLNTPGARCTRQTYDIAVETEISLFQNFDSNANQTILTAQLLDYVTSLPAASNFTDKYMSTNATKTLSQSFKISGTLCEPEVYQASLANDSISLLVHGIGFDSAYWNFGAGAEDLPVEASYVYQAAKRGLTTFRYDRLGTGLSEHPADAYNVVQAATDLAILSKMAAGLRDGSLLGRSYKTVVGVGHSYGAVQCQALTAQEPTALDHVVLTGYSINSTALPLYQTSTAYSIATDVFPDRFSPDELTAAYLVQLGSQTAQLNFVYFPYYTDAAFNLARSTEQPVTQGVLFTFGSLTAPAPDFAGKVHVVTGDKDFIFCLSNCYAVPPGNNKRSILDFVADLYPANSGFSTYIPANTGHGLSAHVSAPETYAEVNDWIVKNL